MRRLIFLLIFGLGGAAILISLGVWQVQRLGWKQDLLSRIESSIAADPVPLQQAVAPEFQRYQAVTMTGRFDGEALHVLASRKTTGAVYRIIRPFEVDGFGRVLVDTGWIRDGVPVPEAPNGPLQMIGNLDAPNEVDGFTPAPDISGNVWFARDVPYMAEVLDTRPILVVLREMPQTDLGVTPWPVDTAGIPNDHLQYAVTWFSLALIWVAMTAYFLTRRPPKEPQA
ncbi:MAG: SURF1 family protein [Pseudomonadota bacterium]